MKVYIDNNYSNKTFKSSTMAKKTIMHPLSGNTHKNIASLISSCNEIFTNLEKNSSLISSLTNELKNVLFEKKALLLKISELTSLRLELIEEKIGNSIQIQKLVDNDVQFSVKVNNNSQLVDYYNKNSQGVDYNSAIKFINDAYELADPEIFSIRRFIRKNSVVPAVLPPVIATTVINNEEDKPKEKPESGSKKYTLPSSIGEYNSKAANFSYRELSDQNKLAPEARREERKHISFFMPLEKFKEKFPEKYNSLIAQRQAITTENNKDEITTVELEEENLADIETENVLPEEIKSENMVKILSKTTSKSQKESDKKVKRQRKPRTIKLDKPVKIKTDTVKKIKKEKTEPLPPGLINSELSEKIDEIQDLHKYILKTISSYSAPTIRKLKDHYPGLSSSINRITFANKYEIVMPKRKGYEEYKVLNLKNLATGEEINILNSKNIIKKEIKWNKTTYMPTLKNMSQKEVDECLNESRLADIDNILSELKNLKNYIDTEGWHQRRVFKVYNKGAEEILPSGVLSDSTMDLVNKILELYTQINKTYSAMYHRIATGIRKKYPNLVLTQGSPRIEFKNLVDDKSNVLFHHVKTLHGDCYKFIRHTGQTELEEVYLITQDGKVISNPYSYNGLKYVSNTMARPTQTYYNEKELKDKNIEESILRLAKPYFEKIVDYACFLKSVMDKNGGTCYLPSKKNILSMAKSENKK